jgi:hypothetical protein
VIYKEIKVKCYLGKSPSFIPSKKGKRSKEFHVAMSNDVVHLSIRRKWSTQVDERNSAWSSRGISTKELLKKG